MAALKTSRNNRIPQWNIPNTTHPYKENQSKTTQTKWFSAANLHEGDHLGSNQAGALILCLIVGLVFFFKKTKSYHCFDRVSFHGKGVDTQVRLAKQSCGDAMIHPTTPSNLIWNSTIAWARMVGDLLWAKWGNLSLRMIKYIYILKNALSSFVFHTNVVYSVGKQISPNTSISNNWNGYYWQPW